MRQWHWLAGAVLGGLLLFESAPARAERTPMTRTPGQVSSGARVDITVPYTTSGRTAFGAYSVGPRIYSSPTVDDPNNPQARPVYNLIYYGAQQNFGDRSNGAMDRSTPIAPNR